MHKYYCLLLFSLFTINEIFAQDKFLSDTSQIKPATDLTSTFEKYVRNHPKEKIHVHFDRDEYQLGDTVWYKIYVVNSYNNQLSALSKIAHIEVIDSSVYLHKAVLPLNAGMGMGHLVLNSKNLKPGTYKFNVFTQLVDNRKKFHSFDLNIGMQGDIKTLSSAKKPNFNEEPTLQFYPEGGTFIAGLRSKLVVKSIDSQGNPVSVKGYIADEKDNKVAEFDIGRYGMGLLAISPKQHAKYQAILDKTPAHKSFALPTVIDSGYVLAVNRVVEDTLTIRISKSFAGQDHVILVFQAKGSILNSMLIPLTSSSAVLKVSTASLPTGINEIALFSVDNKLLANRFLFLPEKNPPTNILSLGQIEYGTREPVKIQIKVTDASGTGIPGGYSISVFKANESFDINFHQQTIWSSLVLTQDTQKSSQNLNFDVRDETGKAELDMHLLTQRSRNYLWDEVLSEKGTAGDVNIERGLSIGGKVLNSEGKPMAGAKLNLFSAKEMILIDTIADDKGEFLFENFTVMDSTDAVIKVKNLGEEKNVTILLNNNNQNILTVTPDVNTAIITPNGKELSQVKSHPINLKEKVNILGTVEVAAKRRPVIRGSVYPVAAAPPDYTIEAEELHKIISLTDYLRSRFIGVKIINNKVIGTCQEKEGPMFILLNGLNIDDLSSIDPRSLSGVQIIKGGIIASGMGNQFGESLYGQGTCFGIIFLTSNHHSQNMALSPQQTTGIIRTKLFGFQTPKNFHSPTYLNKTQQKAKDFRDPLYWQPDIITGDDGIANIEFYTSDEVGRYKVVLEGVGINGQIVREVAYFLVNSM